MDKSVKTTLPIVGLGASAGGLEALTSFFKAMPDDSNAAFVVVAHLSPTHISLMPELLQRVTNMPVHHITDGTKVEANHVYVIPPNWDLSITHGRLQLLKVAKNREAHLPIDSFFRALASDCGNQAIGIILSGTGSDGTLGLQAIKQGLGMTMVQSEESAKYDGMPHSAIASRVIDFILPPEEMPAQLLAYLGQNQHTSPLLPYSALPSDTLQKIFMVLRARTHHDFSLYKPNTICRRIERRMHVNQITAISDYLRYLQENEQEVLVLFQELLIGVTNFFRDEEAFIALSQALMAMLRDKPDDYNVRIWVTGCSTGEEAYSIGILLLECMEELKRHFPVQIFGTDIDEQAITIARSGIYPAGITENVSPERIRRFFNHEQDGRYRIKKQVRELLVFAEQNLIKDPPFTKLDLICCRNLLIYLGPELQQRLMPMFHYSLKAHGILFLGTSETTGSQSDYFTTLDKKWKIFQSTHATLKNNLPLIFPSFSPEPRGTETAMTDSINKIEEISGFQMVAAILQESDAPPCVIIDNSNNILYVHGKTGKFLEPAEGKVSVNVLEMVKQGLKKELADAIRRVHQYKQEVTAKGLHIPFGDKNISLTLVVKPILTPTVMRGMLMVIFDELSEGAGSGRQRKTSAKKKTKTIDELEQELKYTRDNLQTTIEELETSNEELKSTNEELQSTNEELQSTNEELETSKEELQSLNEESSTVNTELQSRLDDLTNANDDMKNLLDSTDIAIIFLNTDICIRRFTPRVTDIIPLTTSDIGRPMEHFSTSLIDDDLTSSAREVLQDLVSRNKEYVSRDGKIYAVRLRPYRTISNLIDGVVITFQDITGRKTAEKQLQAQVEYTQAIIRTVREPLLVLDPALKVVSGNPAFYTMFSVNEAEVVGSYVYEVGNGQLDIPALKALLEDILPSSSSFEDFPLEHQFDTGGQRRLLINARKINSEANPLILLSMVDTDSQGNHEA